ncbi:MAG: hypothetical protein M1816_005435 [Peltula sp. TS41687]|nr:MAG: hypothetical protein M1816_005435 [Peltula sp. TS41687]
MTQQQQQPKQWWITLALASGFCAAFNGVFAKLTTTEMTSGLAGTVAQTIGLARDDRLVEWGLRGMWALFTSALTRSSSSTHVSVVNTSANFILTAMLGFLVFREKLPPLWWAGAALLVGGNVIIGRRAEKAGEVKIGDGGGGGDHAAPGTTGRAGVVEEVPLIEVGEGDGDGDGDEEDEHEDGGVIEN